MQKSRTTRRALLTTGLAAGTAAAATGLPAGAAEHPDAKLLALADPLRSLFGDATAAFDSLQELRAPRDAARDALRADYDAGKITWDEWAKEGRRILDSRPQECDRAYDEWCEANRRLRTTCFEILARPAATLEGFGVQAAAASLIDTSAYPDRETECELVLARLAALVGFGWEAHLDDVEAEFADNAENYDRPDDAEDGEA
jgi:hypothetical protein